jgi:hypothetical protein
MRSVTFLAPLAALSAQNPISTSHQDIAEGDILSHGQITLFDQTPATELDWDTAHTKAVAFVAQLNVSEKINMVTGGFDVGDCIGNIGPIERLSFRGLCMADGPAGVNRADLASAFPAGLTTAATWDVKLMYQRGRALGDEFRGKGAHVLLGYVHYDSSKEKILTAMQTFDRTHGSTPTRGSQLGRLRSGSISRWQGNASDYPRRTIHGRSDILETFHW